MEAPIVHQVASECVNACCFPHVCRIRTVTNGTAAAHGWSASLVHARLGEERVAGTVPHHRRAVDPSRDPQSCVMRQKPILNIVRIELLKLDLG